MGYVTDPGLPTYVEDGYVDGYQERTTSDGHLPPETLPTQGVTFAPSPTPHTTGGGITPQWPTLPPTLPPVGCPPLNSTWSAGPSDVPGNTLAYTPPLADPNDDGIVFPAVPQDLILSQAWHGKATTVASELPIANLELENAIRDAIKQATSQDKTIETPGISKVVIPALNFGDIQVAVETAIWKATQQGAGLWFELVLKPLQNGPFANYYVVSTQPLLLPMGVNLSAPST